MSAAEQSDAVARSLAAESFRHSWDMSDERLVDGAWVAGLCCECGEFVPFGQEVDHLAKAFAPLIREAQAEVWDEALGSCNDYSGDAPNPFMTPGLATPATPSDTVAELLDIAAEGAARARGEGA